MKKCKELYILGFCILLICNIYCMRSCTHEYHEYKKSIIHDTIYIEKKYHIYNLPHVESGIIQEKYTARSGNRYFWVRSFSTGELKRVKVGVHDYETIEYGDTIIGYSPDIIHDTIEVPVYVHIENGKIKKHAYVFPGKPSGIVVEGHCNGSNENPTPGSCVLTIRTFDDSDLVDIKVGSYDYTRINLGDTIYGK